MGIMHDNTTVPDSSRDLKSLQDCRAASSKEKSYPYIENVRITEGTWRIPDSGDPYSVTEPFSVRTCSPVHLRAGDLIKISSDRGKYSHALCLWRDGTSSEPSPIRNDGECVSGDEEVRVAFDGCFVCSFCLCGGFQHEIHPESFSGSITLIRDSLPHDMLLNNPQAIKYAIGCQYDFTERFTDNIPAKNLATIVHVTDVHGDRAAFMNAYEVAKLLNADAFIATGDMVYHYATDETSYIAETVADRKADFLMCVGNHDAFLLDDKEQYEKYIEPFAAYYGYKLNTAVSYPTYYYRDFPEKRLRVLVVNQFEYDRTGSRKDTRMHFTQEQVDFIAEALLKTPQGYGVLIAMHAPERFPVKDLSYAKFFQEPVIYSVSCNSEMTVLTDMVDAFIGRKAITRTYKNLNGAVPASVTLNADFSHANPDTEFIAYMCGHFHIDAVSFVPGTEHKQLLLELTTSNSWTGMQKLGYSGTDNPFLAEFSDIRRAAGTPASDSFNVYTIDRTDKAVNIIRIGANMPSRMDGLRDYMRIPYADQ